MAAGRRAVLAVLLATLAAPAAACPAVAVVRLADGAEVARLPAPHGFALRHIHSVTLTEVEARYTLAPDGTLRQTEERATDPGPGMDHTAPMRTEGGALVTPLDRPVARLVLRAAPAWDNRLIAGATTLDLTR
ncbi:DUF1850 domain-containing protein, partial [Rhodobaculum claviforme]